MLCPLRLVDSTDPCKRSSLRKQQIMHCPLLGLASFETIYSAITSGFRQASLTLRSGLIFLASLPTDLAARLMFFFVVYVLLDCDGLFAFFGLLVVITTELPSPDAMSSVLWLAKPDQKGCDIRPYCAVTRAYICPALTMLYTVSNDWGVAQCCRAVCDAETGLPKQQRILLRSTFKEESCSRSTVVAHT